MVGLLLVKCYETRFSQAGERAEDVGFLHKAISLLDEILLLPVSPTYRIQALIYQCGIRLSLWPCENDVTILDQAIEVAESIRPEMG